MLRKKPPQGVMDSSWFWSLVLKSSELFDTKKLHAESTENGQSLTLSVSSIHNTTVGIFSVFFF